MADGANIPFDKVLLFIDCRIASNFRGLKFDHFMKENRLYPGVDLVCVWLIKKISFTEISYFEQSPRITKYIEITKFWSSNYFDDPNIKLLLRVECV